MRKHTKLKEMHIVRYADDFKIFTNSYQSAKKIFEAVKLWLKERLNLEISPEKSKITNLRKNYALFLGFKLKLHRKGKKEVVKSHVSDKARRKIIKSLVEQIKKAQHSKGLSREIWLLNSKIIGHHNFYQIATNCSKDFGVITFIVSRAIKHRLRPKRAGTAQGYVKKRYGDSNQLRFVGDTPIVPIGYIQHRNPMDKKRAINNYTVEGRAEIHNNLGNVDMSVLHHLMENVSLGENAEVHQNKIALYSGQNGNCYVTGKPLEIGDIHCHHKVPKHIIKNNSYSNLVLITVNVHRLLHSTKADTIKHYISLVNPDNKQRAKINRLRKMLGIACI